MDSVCHASPSVYLICIHGGFAEAIHFPRISLKVVGGGRREICNIIYTGVSNGCQLADG